MNQFQQQNQPNPYLNRMSNVYGRPSNGINWVQGIEGAKAWQMDPNSNVQLMDSENNNIMYIKICDGAGMCNLRVFRYEEVTDSFNKSANANLADYVRKDELQALIQNIIGGMQDEQSVSATKSTAKTLIT